MILASRLQGKASDEVTKTIDQNNTVVRLGDLFQVEALTTLHKCITKDPNF